MKFQDNGNLPPLRAALLGCGMIGSSRSTNPAVGVLSHAEAISICPETELLAVCDPVESRASEVAGEFGVQAEYTNVDRLLDEVQPEFVSIATPDHTHANIGLKVLRASSVRAVLLEKPIALECAEGRRLIESAQERNIAFAVNFSRRYSSVLGSLSKRIRGNEFGPLQAASGVYTKGIRHNGSHWIDWLRFMAGQNIVSVRATAHCDINDEEPTPDVEFLLNGGAMARLTGCSKDAYTIFEMDLLFESGRIRMTDSGFHVEVWRPAVSDRQAGYRYLEDTGESYQNAMKDLMLHAVHDLAACCRTGIAPKSTAESALIAAEAGDAALRSLQQESTWVQPKGSVN